MTDILRNPFKEALARKELQIGLWMSSISPYVAEIAATSNYDWLLFDGEHGPHTIQSLHACLQAVAPYQSHAVVRPLEASRALVKQTLDIGAQTILIPMIDTAEEAAAMVSALRYPPVGGRGVGAGVARAARWGRVDNYMARAADNLCLLVQAETKTAIENLDAIASTEGVDGVFIGPADLSASLGYPDNAGHPDVVTIIEKSIKRICSLGKAAGTLAVDPAMARKCIEWGATFVAVAVDTMLYTDALDKKCAEFKKVVIKDAKASY